MGHKWHDGKFVRVALLTGNEVESVRLAAKQIKFNSTIHIFRNRSDLELCENDYEITIGMDNPRSSISVVGGDVIIREPDVPLIGVAKGKYKRGVGTIVIPYDDKILLKVRNNPYHDEYTDICRYFVCKYQFLLMNSFDNVVGSPGICKINSGVVGGNYYDDTENSPKVSSVFDRAVYAVGQYKLDMVKDGRKRILRLLSGEFAAGFDGYKCWNRDPRPDYGTDEEGRYLLFDIDQVMTCLSVREYDGMEFSINGKMIPTLKNLVYRDKKDVVDDKFSKYRIKPHI